MKYFIRILAPVLALFSSFTLQAVEVGILRSTLSASISNGDGDDDLASHYNGQTGMSATLISGVLDAAAVTPYDLFVIMLPDDAFAMDETAVLSDYVNGGGTLLLIGEQNGFSSTENGHLNTLMASLGSSMSLESQSLGSGFETASGNQIANHPINLNITSLNFGNVNSISGVASGNELIFTSGLGNVWAATENIGRGRIVLLADSNLLSNIEDTGSNDNGSWFSNVAAIAAGCARVPADAIAWWRAEDNALDTVGSHHGTLVNGATFADGRVNRAFSFDNSLNAAIQVSAPAELTSPTQLSVEAWVYPHSFPNGAPAIVRRKSSATPAPQFTLALGDGINSGFPHFNAGADGAGPVSTEAIPLNTWSHIVGTFDGTTANIYVNGVLMDSDTATGSIPSSSNDLFIGNSVDLSDRGFDGLIDELAIYTRALTSEEVASLFNSGGNGKCVPTLSLPKGAISSWQGNGNANDSIGSNHGTPQNGVTYGPGIVGQAFHFDGNNQFVEVSDSATLDVTSAFTLEGWVRFDSFPDGEPQIIASKGSIAGAGTTSYALWYDEDSQVISGAANNNSGGSNTVSFGPFTDTTDFHHVALIYNGSSLILYVDGDEKQTAALSGTILNTSVPFYIGKRSGAGADGNGDPMIGSVDELTLYNTALSPTDIAAIHAAGAIGKSTSMGTTYTWFGSSGDWSEGAKWSPQGVPGPADHAVIHAGVIGLDYSPVAASLTFTGGTIAGANNLTVNDELEWSGGTFSGIGSLSLPPATRTFLETDNTKTIQSTWTINNGGYAIWNGTGNIAGSNGSLFENNGTFEIRNAQTIDYTSIGSQCLFRNNGTILKTVTGATVMDFQFENNGVVDVRAGTINYVSISTFNDGSSLLGEGTAVLDGSTYTLNGTITGDGLQFQEGALAGTGTITGKMTWLDGQMSGSGNSLTIADTGSLRITGSGSPFLQAGFTLNNDGTLTIENTGTFLLSNAPVINNSGLIEITSNVFMDYNNTGSQPSLNNTGTLRRTTSSGTAILDLVLNNTAPGKVEVQSGQLSLSLGGTSDGTFDVGDGLFLNFSGGTHIINTGTSFTGSGTSRVVGASLQFDGDATSDGIFELSSVGSSFFLGTGMLTIQSGGHFEWWGGTMSGPGTTLIEDGATLSISTDATKAIRNGWTLHNEGMTTWTGTGDIDGFNGGLIENAGFWEIQNDANFDYTNTGNRPSLVNTGTFRKTTATGDSTIEFTLSNSGTFDVQTGTVSLPVNGEFQEGSSFTGDGRFRVTGSECSITGNVSGPGLEIQGGTLLGGGGTVNGELHWTGGVFRSGTLNIGESGQLFLEGPSTKTLNSTFMLNNSGTLTWTEGTLTSANQPTINNSGLFDIQTDAFFDYTNTGGEPTINNTGTLQKSAGTGTATQTLLTGASFTGMGTHRIQGTGEVQANGDTSVPGNLELAAGGILSGTGTITITGAMDWSGGIQSGSGTTLIDDGSTLTISGSAHKEISSLRTIQNDGMATWSGSGDLRGRLGGQIVNNGTLEIQNDQTFDYINIGDRPSFLNSGTIRKTSSTGTTTMDFSMTNTGVIDVEGGIFQIVVASTLGDGSMFIGAGKTQLTTAAFSISGQLGGPSLEFESGTLTGTATLNGTLSWTGGFITGNHTLTIAETGTIQISGASTKRIENLITINNEGTITLAGSANLGGRNGGTINNSGTFDIQNDQGLDYENFGDQVSFNNSGTLRKSSGTGTSLFDFNFSNSGTVEIQSGTLDFRRTYNQTDGQTSLAGGNLTSTFEIGISGGVLSGSGTVTGDVSNTGGEVQPGSSAGTLTIDGDYSQSSSASLLIELGGTTPDTEHDQLVITGSATLDGVLKINRILSYVPDDAHTFDVVTYASHTGRFSSLSAALANGTDRVFTTNYGSDRLTISITDGKANFDASMITFSGNDVIFTLTGADSQTYQLEFTTDFSMWTPVGTTVAVAGTGMITHVDALDEPIAFYRASLVLPALD